MQGWGAGSGRNRVILAPWSRSRLRKKPGAGAGAAPKKGGRLVWPRRREKLLKLLK